MLNSISNVLTNNTFVNIAQSTKAAMSIETGLKATGRPAFILMDKNITTETKKYAATKELLYQLTCLGVYMGLVLPVFRKCGFKAFKSIFKNKHGYDKFNNLDEFTNFQRLKGMSLTERTEEIKKLEEKAGEGKKVFTESIYNKLKKNNLNSNQYTIIKGADELSSICGSVAGLAILAPQVSHVTIHPILKMLNMDKKSSTDKGEQKLDTKA